MIEQLLKYSALKRAQPLPEYRRFLYQQIDYDAKLIGLIGARGAGKTTLMLQYLASRMDEANEILYVSCDHPLVASVSLFELAEVFSRYGGKILAIDEIHKKTDFCVDLKNIYDFFDIQVIFTGSSALSLEECQSDLSRRALVYRLPVLSLREYIEMKIDLRFEPLTLPELTQSHIRYAQKILRQIKPLKYYGEYIRQGAYPFVFEGEMSYAQRLIEIVHETLVYDLATIHHVSLTNIETLNKLLKVLCRSAPYTINYESISRETGIAKNTLKHYLLYLNRASLIRTIGGMSRGNTYIKKPDKIYLHNTNLFDVLCEQTQVGTIRETFFASQTAYRHTLHYPPKGDFLVDELYTFEVGGPNKSFDQIKNIPNSYVVVDDTEIGFGNKIPLWLFGFLY
jgi:predicted AAA+ superfamily ATPase